MAVFARYTLLLCVLSLIILSYLAADGDAKPRRGGGGRGGGWGGGWGGGRGGSRGGMRTSNRSGSRGHKGATKGATRSSTWMYLRGGRIRGITSTRGGTRTIFGQFGSYGRGGKSFGTYLRHNWRKALLLGLTVRVAVQGRGRTGRIAYYGASDYLASTRARMNIPPTVCYNDKTTGEDGSIIYYFLCPMKDTNEEYCCNKNDDKSRQYCCTRSEWSGASTIFTVQAVYIVMNTVLVAVMT